MMKEKTTGGEANFSHLFGSSNPFESFFTTGPGGMPQAQQKMSFGDLGNVYGNMGKQGMVKEKTIEKEVLVSLEDIATGCQKKLKINKNIHREDGSITKESKVITLDIKAGWKSGTKVTFDNEGDQVPGKNSSRHRVHHQGQAPPSVLQGRGEHRLHHQDQPQGCPLWNQTPNPNFARTENESGFFWQNYKTR